ncbi:hypothetical protein XI08_39065 [Bradyrhizobium sp. CCBAU 11361]|nr:hypothetical protein [Bradyrhizobium sp. CCBAU 11361]
MAGRISLSICFLLFLRHCERSEAIRTLDPHPEEPRLRGVSKGEATSRAFILRDARSALLRMRDWQSRPPRHLR